jgi:Txe/YoeB family toxin of Txe-Axe toxin-antitoxin module
MLKKINDLVKDIIKSLYEGTGKPEPLKYDLTSLTGNTDWFTS